MTFCKVDEAVHALGRENISCEELQISRMQEKAKARLRDIARRRQTRMATRDLRGSA